MKMIREFLKYESAAGILLVFATILALIMENSYLATIYERLLTVPAIIQIGRFTINKPLLLWINDGLMTIFFLLVGLEIKREMIEGYLSEKEQVILPTIAALGGLIVPALIYCYFNWGDTDAMRGWAIPAATDIAFALGVLSLLGKRVPDKLKICLVTVAILDDIAAIVIIALFYTEDLSFFSLAFGAICIVILATFNRRGVTAIAPYVVTGILLWTCVLKSGVHATLAGVLLALFIPLRATDKSGKSPARSLEHALHPWVAYVILPIFAFANAGVSLSGLSMDTLTQPITLGIVVGLFFGKQIGVLLSSALAVNLKLCKLPQGVNWKQYYGMALITGIGFTMSLFIGTLAFDDIERQTYVRIGVLLGSMLSGFLGYILLRAVKPKSKISSLSEA